MPYGRVQYIRNLWYLVYIARWEGIHRVTRAGVDPVVRPMVFRTRYMSHKKQHHFPGLQELRISNALSSGLVAFARPKKAQKCKKKTRLTNSPSNIDMFLPWIFADAIYTKCMCQHSGPQGWYMHARLQRKSRSREWR